MLKFKKIKFQRTFKKKNKKKCGNIQNFFFDMEFKNILNYLTNMC
jgi:hypothetical protein